MLTFILVLSVAYAKKNIMSLSYFCSRSVIRFVRPDKLYLSEINNLFVSWPTTTQYTIAFQGSDYHHDQWSHLISVISFAHAGFSNSWMQICSLSHSIWEILHHTEFFTQASPLLPVTNISYDHDHDHHDNEHDHHDNWNKLFLCLRPIKLLSQLDRPFAQLTHHPIIIIITMHHNHHTPPSSSRLLSSKLDANFNLKPLQFYSQLANLGGGSDKLLQLSSDLILLAPLAVL